MSKIIDLKPGKDNDESINMSYINGKWRCAEYEIRKAESDNKKLEIEAKGKEIL